MKKIYSYSLFIFVVLINSCSNVQTQSTETNLSAKEFESKIKEFPNAPIVDVRTADEFSNGHLVKALNCDWNGSDFDKQIATLDKSKPVFVYCLSGGRSSSAADKMRSNGFVQVFEMDGGMMKWRAANLPETTNKALASNGMTQNEFETMIQSDKLVLVDFYADWCAPCKKMKPYLDEISKDMADKVVVLRVNVVDNQSLCKLLKIDGLPVLQLYKNNTLIWANSGYIDKDGVLEHLH